MDAPARRTLVVIFPGMGGSTERMEPVAREIKAAMRGAKPEILTMDTWWTSNSDPVELTRKAMEDIDTLWRTGEYDRLIFVGYSFGGLIARKAFVYAWGKRRALGFEARARGFATPRPWVEHVERIVLLAGMNRGWSFASSMNRFAALGLELLYNTFRAFGFCRLAASVRRGAPFVADLRLQWLQLMRFERPRRTAVIQLLGTIDDVVSPDDAVDRATGRDFIYPSVPYSGHKTVVEFDHEDYGEARRAVFRDALTQPPETLEREGSKAAYIDPPDTEMRHVLFVVHGIRDHGFWTSHIGGHIVEKAARRGIRMKLLTPTYGYFAMLPFVLPWTRRRNVRWFMDQYADAVARYPNAVISYVGHSNGTYLLAGALASYENCRFFRVIFAGSVVRNDFPWDAEVPKRVKGVLNYVATADKVVAIFPRFMGRLGADVGGAGHDGFVPPVVHDMEYAVGGHDAALKENHWKTMGDFILNGTVPPQSAVAQSIWTRTLAFLAPVVWLFLLAVVLLPLLLFAACGKRELGTAGWWLAGTIVWFRLMLTILTRF